MIVSAKSKSSSSSSPPLSPLRRRSCCVVRAIVVLVLVLCLLVAACSGNPHSKAYIPFRTDPYDQAISKNDVTDFRSERSSSESQSRPRMYEPEKAVEQDPQCPLRFSLGVSRRSNDSNGLGGAVGDSSSHSSSPHSSSPMGIHQPPVIYPVLPWQGPGRQVVYATQYEHLDLLTPMKGTAGISSSSPDGDDLDFGSYNNFLTEGLTEHLEFPLLFESSAFQTSPVIADVNGDGILDAILTDYHGGVYAIGLQVGESNNNNNNKKKHKGTNHRYFLKAQVPRMYVRRQWLEAAVNETLGIDPYEAEKAAEEAERVAEEARKAARSAEATEADPNDTEAERERKRNRYRANDERPYDPYHSYFEYSYGSGSSAHEPILRGVTASLLGQDTEHVAGLDERRNRVHHGPGSGSGGEDETIIYDSYEEEQKQQHVVYDSAEEKQQQKVIYDSVEEQKKHEQVIYDSAAENHPLDNKNGHMTQGFADEQQHHEENHRRLLEVDGDDALGPTDDQVEWGEFQDDAHQYDDDDDSVADDNTAAEDGGQPVEGEAKEQQNEEGRAYAEGVHVEGDDDPTTLVGKGDDNYPRYGDDDADADGNAGGSPHDDYGRYDDFYSGRYNDLHEDYFDDKHYIRLPPHILCTPVVAELPKLYSQKTGETETLLFLAVSYYFDEDEYEGFFSYKRFANGDRGDETETKRGMYTANAIMMFHFGDNPRWGRQEHLDLSADHSAPVNMTMVGSIPMREDNTKLGAFALSSPTIADIDGDGSLEVLMGTSMGFLYVMDARNLYMRGNFPIQLQYGIESRVLVEDVRGDTNLEIFVMDVGGNVFCLDHVGKKVWHRNLLHSVAANDPKSEVLGSSPMVLGDVNGDGILDIVVNVLIKKPGQGLLHFLFALSADTGMDIEEGRFPINIWTKAYQHQRDTVGEDFVHTKLPAPLLVDMHEDQDHIADYLRRNGTRWSKPPAAAKSEFFKFNSKSESGEDSRVPHGGSAGGLHIVQPVDTFLVIVEAGSGCTQSIEIGEPMNAMVQADDVHGTNKLDLVISTAGGNVVTLESDAPFHPLNVWNNGELRSRTNGVAHGYSASQGIFVHEMSRRYRDIFGVYVPVTFEIFDNRPNIENEPDKRRYNVEIRAGTSQLLFLKAYDEPGTYTERLYIPQGPGHYELSVILRTSHGLVYEDAFHIGYNVNYMDGFSMLLWLPLTMATVCVFLMGAKKSQNWDDEDYEISGSGGGGGGGKGILDGGYGGLPE